MAYDGESGSRAVACWTRLLPAAVRGAELGSQEKAAGTSGELEHGQFRRIATGAGNWAIYRRQDSTNAKILWRVQERRRFARDQRHRTKTARQNAQVLDRRKSSGGQGVIRKARNDTQTASHQDNGEGRGRTVNKKEVSLQCSASFHASIGTWRRRASIKASATQKKEDAPSTGAPRSVDVWPWA